MAYVPLSQRVAARLAQLQQAQPASPHDQVDPQSMKELARQLAREDVKQGPPFDWTTPEHIRQMVRQGPAAKRRGQGLSNQQIVRMLRTNKR